jgi:hypothetical protein
VNSASESGVPEPFSIGLSACGLALLGIIYRRRMPQPNRDLIFGGKK